MPQRVTVAAERTGAPAAPTATWRRRLLLTALAVAVAVVTVAVLVDTAHAQAYARAHAWDWALVCLDHQPPAPGMQAPGRP
jgi:hypothetical protein